MRGNLEGNAQFHPGDTTAWQKREQLRGPPWLLRYDQSEWSVPGRQDIDNVQLFDLITMNRSVDG